MWIRGAVTRECRDDHVKKKKKKTKKKKKRHQDDHGMLPKPPE
jgi:hypothetical protein